MEDTFRSRVDKVFGSLPGAAPTAAATPSSSLWSLTDDEVEAVRWRKSADEEDDDDDDDMESLSAGLLVGEKPKATPAAGFLDPIENDLDDLDDEEEEEEKKKCGGSSSDAPLEPKPDDYNEEEWEVKNSIGRDCTLDFEEEEDQYDKVAVGKEKSGDRVYMKELTRNEYDIDIDTGSSGLLKKGFLKKDPRANHMAAKLRLKEDDEAAANKIDSLKVSNNGSQQESSLKSILKRKDDQEAQKKKQSEDSKSNKRVRFDPECDEDPSADDTEMEGDVSDDSLVYRLPDSYPNGIPDYMRNPTNYTKYTFDMSNVDEGSNRQAYMDFLKLIKKSEPEEDDLGGELPKSLQFVPRKKNNGNNDSMKNNQGSIGDRKGVIAAAAADDDADLEGGEACDMDEDVPATEAGTQTGSSGKPGRQYRMKAKA
ncbi:hypothetical protein LINGRAHAP2_LOCUS9464 [Linum grandiflorum]